MGSGSIQPQAPTGAVVTIFKNGEEFSVSGPMEVLLEYIEKEPKFWLRLLALNAEEKNGEAENRDD
jgi:hypothetical protein